MSSRRKSATNLLTDRPIKVGSENHKKLSDAGLIKEDHIHETRTSIDSMISAIKRSKVPLKDYQQNVVRHLRKNRGLIAIHSVGSGKTLTAVAFSQMYLSELNPEGKVFVITPSTLEENFRKEMLAYSPDITFGSYVFLSYEKFHREYQKGNITCRRCCIIVDEAHNLRTKVTEKGGKRVASVIEFSETAERVLLLTATPFVNETYDIANLVGIVRGPEYPIKTKSEFERIISAPRRFQIYFSNIISMYNNESKVREHYPDYSIEQVPIVMSPEYYEKYDAIEYQIGKTIDGFENPYVFYNGLRRACNRIDDSEVSPKMKWISDFFDANRESKTVIFSNWVDFGTNAIEKILKFKGIGYGIVSGETSIPDRVKYVREYNTGKSNVLVITKAGSEGLDLKGTRFVVITDPGWNSALDQQIIGRAVRYGSHEDLPENERFVQVYKLFLVKPEEKVYINKHGLKENQLFPGLDYITISTDLYLRNMIIKKRMETNDMLMKLKQYSI